MGEEQSSTSSALPEPEPQAEAWPRRVPQPTGTPAQSKSDLSACLIAPRNPADSHSLDACATRATEVPTGSSVPLAARLEGARVRVSPRFWAIGLYWAVQFVVVSMMAEVIFTGGSLDSLRFWERLYDAEERLVVLIMWGGIVALQAGFLSPVPRPEVVPGSRPSWARLIAGGLSVSMLVTLPAWALVTVVFPIMSDVFELSFRQTIMVFGVAWLSIGAVVILMLRHRCREGMPLKLSVLIAGAMCAALAGGALFLASSMWDLFTAWLKVGVFDSDFTNIFVYAMTAVVLGVWGVSTPLLWAYIKGRPRENALQRIASRLFVGTVVEVIVIIPFDVMVRRKTSCYCAEGTFWALVWCGTVGAFLLGPMIYLAPFGRRRRRLLAGHCPGCGYDLSPTPNVDRCPECGLGWGGAA